MTVEWDGHGLPPAARARIERAAQDHVSSSLLTIRGQTAIQGVGLDPVGEVMGCIVERIGFSGWGGCGYYGGGFGGGLGGGFGGPSQTVTSGAGGGYGGYAPYVDALYHGYDTALARMMLEAQALGGDGVVGVSWTQQRLGETGSREFVARGTAVRVRSARHLDRPFCTDLAGGDVSKLLYAGWVPAALVLGVSVAIRHDDYATRVAAGSWSMQNMEIPGYTELVSYARADARARFEDRAAAAGGDAATVSNMSLGIRGIEPSAGHVDHVAEAIVVGNALARFHQGAVAPTSSTMVLPLRRSTP